jgi:hypothetical protein
MPGDPADPDWGPQCPDDTIRIVLGERGIAANREADSTGQRNISDER